MEATQMPMPIDSGYRAAVERVMAAGLFDGQADPLPESDARHALFDAQDTLQGDEPDRYVELYAEIVAVAAFARTRYSEDPLGHPEVKSYNERLRGFLNSWVHRHGEQ
jgi:hypothetical protein